MVTTNTPSPFQTGFRLTDGGKLNAALANPQLSTKAGIVAGAGGSKASAVLMNAAINHIVTSASAGDSVILPAAALGAEVLIANDGANSIRVYATGSDTLNGTAGATGVLQPAGDYALYFVTSAGKWHFAPAAGGVFGAITATTINGNTLATGSGAIALNSPTPIAAGSTLAVTAAMSNSVIKLDTAAGSVATLPAATGSGNRFRFVVTTTASSNAHKILAASSSDFLNGNAVGHVSAGTTLAFSAAAATAHSIQMPFAGTQPSGGFIGDWFEFIDVAANLWAVSGMYQSGTTSTTPFSAATS